MYCAHCGSPRESGACPVCGERATSDDAISSVSTTLAGWWRRAGATLIDGVVLIVPSTILVAILGNGGGEVATLLMQAAYVITLQTRPEGQTIGNRVVRTRVRDALTGRRVSTQQALMRWLVMALIASLLSLSQGASDTMAALALVLFTADSLYPLVNVRKQTIHDRLAHTIVIRE